MNFMQDAMLRDLKEKLEPVFTRHGVQKAILAAGVPVDLLIYTPEEFESMRRRRWLANALAKGVLIHES